MEDVVRDSPRDMEREEEPADAAYRGFLFADLRGYTAFVERHGDAAAADLLDTYRSLVRDEVARHAGAEIRTEGDSFYVVFRSARRAAACGLAIVAAAGQLRRDQPERPIRVGIGINAGETVQRGEAFVGTAVNLAARVCAQAREGEVLVTAPVRDAVGSGAGLRFEPRGTRRLKGIARPVPLFSVRPASEPIGRSIPWLPVGMAAASLIVVAVAVSARMLGGASPSTEPSPVAGLHTDSPVPEATQATSATPSDAGAYPNAAEAELLSKLDESIRDDCARADDDDRPRFNLGEGIPAFGRAPREPIQIDAGLACEIASFGAPDLVQLWATRRTLDYDPADVPPALIANRAGSLGIPSGDCSTQNVGYGRWTLGDLGGWLLCRVDDGDAVIEWSYDDRPILGMALRRDGDLAALLRWWTAEARLLRP